MVIIDVQDLSSVNIHIFK